MYKTDETTALIENEETKTTEFVVEPNITEQSTFKKYYFEAKALMKLAFPMMMTNLLAFLILTETVIFCGQLGKYEMDGASLANSLVNSMGISMAVGLCTGCDTFFSQILGSKHKKYLGIMLQRSFLAIITVPVILIAIHLNWEPFLIAIGQDLLVVKYCMRFLTLFCPGFIFIFLSLLLNRYLQNQHYVFFPLFSAIITNIFNVVSQYVSIVVLDYGFDAAPICQCLAYFINFFVQLNLIYWSGLYKQYWTGFSKEAFLEWGKFYSLSIAGMFLVFFETFSWELGTFLSGILGPVALGAQAIIFHFETALFQACFAIGVAVNIRVGEALGSSNWRLGLLRYRCGLIITVIYAVCASVLVFTTKEYTVLIFTSEKDIQELAVETLPYMLLALIGDFLGTINNGALRGCGKHTIGIVLVLFGYYVLGLPVGAGLAFGTNLNIKGLWLGLCFALIIYCGSSFIYASCVLNWRQQAKLAQKRIKTNLHIVDDDKNENSDMFSVSVKQHHRRKSSTLLTPNPDPTGPIKVTEIYVSPEEYKKIYIKRFLVYLIAMIIFIIGIILRVTIPVQPYVPPNNLNVTSSGP